MKKIVLTSEQEQKFQELYKQGYKDTEIASVLQLSRKIVGRYRREKGLFSYKNDGYVDIDKIKDLCSKNCSIKTICRELHISEYKLKRLAAANNIVLPFNFVITPELENKIIALYNQGKTDVEIGNSLGIKSGTVNYYRRTHNLATTFTYDKIDKISKTNFKELFDSGLSDYEIAKRIGMSPDGVYSHRIRHGFTRDSLAVAVNKPLSEFQKQALLGIMLGDGWMGIGKGSINPKVRISHCVKQKEYSEHIAEIFRNLGWRCVYRVKKTPDSRNNICYESYEVIGCSNPAFLPLYYSLYPDGKKHIPFDHMDYFTPVSLAYMFMDDGTKTSHSYSIATNCFEVEELEQFRIILKQKFNLETSLFKSKVLYIRAKSKDLFTSLVSPYIIPCMQYKLHTQSS